MLICLLSLLLLLMPSVATAQDLDELAVQLERARLLANALKDQLEEMRSGAEVSDVQRAALLLEGLTDELPKLDVPEGLMLRDRSSESGFRALYLANRDGSNAQLLTAAPGMIASATPAWSPSGRMIAFDAHPQAGRFKLSHLFVYATSGPFKGSVKDLGCGNVPTWSPDESQIAFMLNPGNPRGDKAGIWVMNSDGSERRHLCSGWYPNWSPDGQSLCVQSVTDRPRCLRILNLETGENRKFLGDQWSVTYSGATWSPDGTKVIFIGQHQNKQHLATAEVSGDESSVEILYTEEQGRRLYGPPAWSPDGTEVIISIQDAAVGGRMWSNTHLHRVRVDEPMKVELFEPLKQGAINRGMAWSPNGDQLVFSSQR